MTGDAALGVVGAIGALVVVGSAVIARQRRGEPIARSAAIWAGVFALAFVIAMFVDRRT